MYTGHLISDVVFRKHDLFDFSEVFRFIFFYPKDLRRGKAGECDICRILGKFVFPDHVVEIVCLLCRTAVVPQNSRTDHIVIFIQNDKSVHLSAEADARHLCGVKAVREFFDAGSHSIPPVLWTLF